MSRALHYIQKGDIAVFYVINQGVKCRVLDLVMPFITHMGSAVFTISVAAAALIFSKNSSQNFGWNICLSLAFSHFLIHIIKRIVNRPRPNITLGKVNTFNISLFDYSFPSGHTSAAFSVAVSIAITFPQLEIFLIIAAGLVGISRVYLGVHYPTDVFIGGIIGTIAAVIVSW